MGTQQGAPTREGQVDEAVELRTPPLGVHEGQPGAARPAEGSTAPSLHPLEYP